MKSTEKNKIKWIRVIRPMAMSLVLVFLLSYATFAWLKRDFTPTLTQENVKIVAGSSLTFVYVDKEEGYEIQQNSVNMLLGINDFEFQSVSNSTGRSNDFFGLTYGSSKMFDVYNHLDPQEDSNKSFVNAYDNPYTALGRTNGYIEMKFKVSTDIKDPVGIYLHKDSKIEGSTKDKNGVAFPEKQLAHNIQAANAMRVSVTVHGKVDSYEYSSDDMEYIFARQETLHKGIINDYTDGDGYDADKQLQINEKDWISNGISAVALDGATKDTFLFVLSPDDAAKDVTVRIWLEGTDEDCQDAISDAELDIMLKFTAGPINPDS